MCAPARDDSSKNVEFLESQTWKVRTSRRCYNAGLLAEDGGLFMKEVASAGGSRRIPKWLWRGIYFFLIVFAATAPLSIAATQIAYSAALLLWLIGWIFGASRPAPQPLVLPSLVFLLLSTASTALSYAPVLSWAHLKSVALLLISVLWAQNIKSFSQIRLVSAVLIASCLLTVAYVTWQYTVGIGVRLTKIGPAAALARVGLAEGDCISSVDGHLIRDPKRLVAAIRNSGSGPRVRLTILSGEPLHKLSLDANRADLESLGSEVLSGQVVLDRGHPVRAQGFYDHFVTYADVLTQIALLAWGLFAACPRRQAKTKILLGMAFLGVAYALWLTVTRAAMASFLAACLLVVFIVYRWRTRMLLLPLVSLAILVGSILLRTSRGLTWFDLKSPEAQYRLLMWRDGLRLFRDHPLLGVGMDSLNLMWRQWNIEAYKIFPLRSHFHSTPIQIAVERGLLTLVAWLWLLVEYFRVLIRLLRATERSTWFARGLGLGLLGAACAFLLGSLVDYSWGDSEVVMVFWMFVGWSVALDRLLGTLPTPLEADAAG